MRVRVADLVLALAIVLATGLVDHGAGRPLGAGEAVGAAQSPAPNSTSTVRIGVLKGSAYNVVSVPLEEYVARVLTGEALPGSAPPAMEALAIAVRTYTRFNLGRHRADGFDLCDQTHCQVMRTATPTTQRAVQATSGQVLLYQGAPAEIFYSASCGGRTELPSAVWPGANDAPYLPSRPDDGCGGGPVWTTQLALSDLRRSFAASGFRGTLREMTIQSRNASGRVATLRLDGLTPGTISGQDLRASVGRTLGWQHIRSAAFEMRRVGDVYRLNGHGSGHGVGMCVIGAANLAAGGETASALLNRYYPGLERGPFAARLSAAPPSPVAVAVPAAVPPSVPRPAGGVTSRAAPGQASPDGVVVSLPQDEEGERERLSMLVARARDALAAALRVPPPARVAVRFHATTAEYERATGRPWFVTGAVVNGDLHFPPLAPLRDRGVLERMLRRQIVHLLVDDELSRRPEWVRAGAALYFADGQPGQPEALPRAPCPADLELQRPVSAGALSTAFSDARACFERQIASGRSWRDVR